MSVMQVPRKTPFKLRHTRVSSSQSSALQTCLARVFGKTVRKVFAFRFVAAYEMLIP